MRTSDLTVGPALTGPTLLDHFSHSSWRRSLCDRPVDPRQHLPLSEILQLLLREDGAILLCLACQRALRESVEPLN